MTDDPILYFDVDGCLVDSRRPILESLNHAFVAHGLAEITVDDLRRHVGPPLAETIGEILAAHGRHGDDPDPVIASYRSVYGTLSVELAATYDGVEAALDRLAGGHRMAVVTSKPIHFARPILDALGFSVRFEVMEGPSLTEAEAKVVTLARAIDATTPRDGRAAMVGDRRHDVEAAAAHGLPSIGVTWGFGDRDELVGAGADVVVDHPDELDRAVASLLG